MIGRGEIGQAMGEAGLKGDRMIVTSVEAVLQEASV